LFIDSNRCVHWAERSYLVSWKKYYFTQKLRSHNIYWRKIPNQEKRYTSKPLWSLSWRQSRSWSGRAKGKLSTDGDFVKLEHLGMCWTAQLWVNAALPRHQSFGKGGKKTAMKPRITDQFTWKKNLKQKAESFICCLLAINETWCNTQCAIFNVFTCAKTQQILSYHNGNSSLFKVHTQLGNWKMD